MSTGSGQRAGVALIVGVGKYRSDESAVTLCIA